MSNLRKSEDLRALVPRPGDGGALDADLLRPPRPPLPAPDPRGRAPHPGGPSANFIDESVVEAPRGRIFAHGGEMLATNRPAYTLWVTPRPRVIVESDDPKKPPAGVRVPIEDAAIESLAGLIDFVDVDREAFLAAIRERRADERDGIYAFAVRSNLSWQEYARIETCSGSLDSWVEIRESARRYYPRTELTAFLTGYVGEITPDGLRPGRPLPPRRSGRQDRHRAPVGELPAAASVRSRVVDVHGRRSPPPPDDAIAASPPTRIRSRPGHHPHRRPRSPEGRGRGLRRQAGRRPGGDRAPDRQDPGDGLGAGDRSQPLAAADPPGRVSRVGPLALQALHRSHGAGAFLPGSTYKVVSALAALDDPTFDPEREITCDGYVKYGGRKFKCTHKHGPVNLHTAIVESCNVYFYTLAMEDVLTERQEIFARRTGPASAPASGST
ncbi:MAG: penicillin-binding transpeptidase domain-containing protein [Nannocystaceae bacterium]